MSESTDTIAPVAIRAIPCPFAAEDRKADDSANGDNYLFPADPSTDSPTAFSSGFGEAFETPVQNGGPTVKRWMVNEMGFLASWLHFYLQCGGLVEYNEDFVGTVETVGEYAGEPAWSVDTLNGYAKGAVLDFVDGNLGEPETVHVMRIVSTRDNNMTPPSLGRNGETRTIGYNEENPEAYPWACVVPPTVEEFEDELEAYTNAKVAGTSPAVSLDLDAPTVKICVSRFTVKEDSWMFFSTREDETEISVGTMRWTAEETTNGGLPVDAGAVVEASRPIDAYLFPIR